MFVEAYQKERIILFHLTKKVTMTSDFSFQKTSWVVASQEI